MADIQEQIRILEEEKIKRHEAELKYEQDEKARQEKYAKLIEDEQTERIKAQKNANNAERERIAQQEKLSILQDKLKTSSNEKMSESLKKSITEQETLISKTEEELKSRNKVLEENINASEGRLNLIKEVLDAEESLYAEERNQQKQQEKVLKENKIRSFALSNKEKALSDLKEKQVKTQQDALLGINKALANTVDTANAVAGDKAELPSWASFAMKAVGIDPEMYQDITKKITNIFGGEKKEEKKPEKEEVATTDPNQPQKVEVVDQPVPDVEPQKIEVSEQPVPDVQPQKIEIAEQPIPDTKPIQVEVTNQPVPDTKPTKVDVLSEPKPEPDIFAEEKARESSKIQTEQTETQERIADGIEQLVQDQTIKVEGKDTGIFGKILSGKFNPLASLQGIVKGIFGVIEEFIKGIGNVLKSALKVVEKLVKGVGDILLRIVDIIGKGFVKLMTFAGEGIAALFRALGSLSPAMIIKGAIALGVITLAFMGLGKGLQLMAPALKIVVDGFVGLVKVVGGVLLDAFKALISGIKELSTIPFANFLSLAGGLAALVIPLAAFGVAAVIATPGLLGLSLGVGALGVALKLLAPAIETIVPPVTSMLGAFGDFLATLQGIVSNFFTTIGNFIATVGTAISSFISNFAQSLVMMNDADFGHLAWGFAKLGIALASFAFFATAAIPSLLALGVASGGLAELIAIPTDRFDALAESFKMLGYAVKGFAKDAKGLGGAVLAIGALSIMPFAKKLLEVQLAKTETRNVVDTFKGGIADTIQPVDIVSFSGGRTERGIEMLQQAAETAGIRDDTSITSASVSNNITSLTSASSVTNNALVVQDSPLDSQFQASARFPH